MNAEQGPTEEDHASDVGKNCKQQPGNLSDLSKLSLINGAINRMSKMELVTQLRNLKLKANGNKAVTTKRLKEFYKKQRMPSPMMSIQPSTSKARHQVFRYICVIDFEATCEETNKNYPHEIIEFPAILIDIETREVLDEFHAFCQPTINKELSAFCIQLTNITQDQINKAETFETVLVNFLSWLTKLVGDDKVAIVTDGPWDMGRFMAMQCKHSGVALPEIAKEWINIRKTFSNYYKCNNKGILPMLSSLGLTFKGHLHSGLDDARNIARIILHMLHDGAHLRINESMLVYNRRQQLKQPSSSPPSDCSASLKQSTTEDYDGLGDLELIANSSNNP